MTEQELRRIVAAETCRFQCADPEPDPLIDHVIWFSGPGTLVSPIRPQDDLLAYWQEAHRFQKAIELALEVTHLRSHREIRRVTKADVDLYGPTLYYPGTPAEIANLREVINLSFFPIPKDRIVIIDGVEENGKLIPIVHTGHQVKSFLDYLLSNHLKGPAALVSHDTCFSRILRYIQRYIEINGPLPEGLYFRCYPVHAPAKWAGMDLTREEERMKAYVDKGDLAEIPYMDPIIKPLWGGIVTTVPV